MFKGGVEGQFAAAAVGAVDVQPEQRAVDLDRGGVAGEVADQQGEVDAALLPCRQVGVVGEGGGGVCHVWRQGDPQLGGVQAVGGGGGVFGVADAAAGGHQIHLAGANQLFIPEAVAVQHVAFDHPGEGLQAGVRVGAHVHAFSGFKAGGAGVIKEAPGADLAALAGGQHPVDWQGAADFGSAGHDSLWCRCRHGTVPPLLGRRAT